MLDVPHVVQEKRCSRCGVAKPWGDFYKRKSGKPESSCKACNRWKMKDHRDKDIEAHRAYQRKVYNKNPKKFIASAIEYNRRNPDGVKKRSRKHRLKKYYNLTPAVYDEMVLAQNGGCAICGERETTPLVVDHDHATGIVRALLCRSCNIGLGGFKDNPAHLRLAASYLEKYK